MSTYLRDIHQNNVRTDLLDIFITDHIFRITAEKAFDPVDPRHDDFIDTAGTFVKLKIRHMAHLPAIPYIDHILALQLRKKHRISPLQTKIFHPYDMQKGGVW